MYSEPQVFTISGAAKSLNRLNSTDSGSKWGTSDRKHRLSINHFYGRRERHTFRLDIEDTTPNPLITGQNVVNSYSVIVSVDVPKGFDTTASKAAVDSVLANLSASTGANVTKLVGGEG